jgi:CheY-like chemotaxis protein
MIQILVVSADSATRTHYTQTLAHDGFHVETVPSPEEALSVLMQQPIPRVVLIDVTLPAHTLVGFLTILAVTPTLRVQDVFAGVGDLPHHWHDAVAQLMRDIDMPLIEGSAEMLSLSREVARLALRLQAVV